MKFWHFNFAKFASVFCLQKASLVPPRDIPVKAFDFICKNRVLLELFRLSENLQNNQTLNEIRQTLIMRGKTFDEDVKEVEKMG